MNKWKEFTRKDLCPICGNDHFCSRSLDGRAVSCKKHGGAGALEKTNKLGNYYIHLTDGSAPRYNAPQLPPPPPSAERADVHDLGRVYLAIMHRLSLGSHHQQALRNRGLTDTQIVQCDYRTLPLTGRFLIVKQLIHLFDRDIIVKVPGIITKRGDHGNYLTLAGSPGLLIPVRDAYGAITGLVIRHDDTRGGGGGTAGCLRGLTAAPLPK